MDDLMLARALHVLGVVVWIGGLSMVTTVALPAIRRGALGEDWPKAFAAIERRFVWQARIAVLTVGVTGYHLCDRLDLWSRFQQPAFWWMHAMVGVWAVFFLFLFVGEPLVLDRHFPGWAQKDPARAFRWMWRAHLVLWVASLVTILGAVAGAHGAVFGGRG